MPRTITLALLLLLGFGFVFGAEDDLREAQKKAFEDAQEEFDEAEAAYDEIVREMEHDFDLIRGEHWSKIAPRFELAIEEVIRELKSDEDFDVIDGLKEGFYNVAAVCNVTYGRLAKAIEAAVREAAKKEEEVDSAPILAAGLKVVFPEESFEDCWDKHFMDLPHIARYDKAEAALLKAEAALDAPLLPPLPKCDGPAGTVYIPKTRFVFGPWTGWEFDLKKNKAEKPRVKPFYIDAFEVTNRDFQKFLTGLEDADLVKKYLPEDFRIAKDGTIAIPRGTGWQPVTGLTFAAATAYAESLGKRLPTEEEWECAARGEEGLLYPWGADFEKSNANSLERGLNRKANIGAHPKDRSPFGVYDMGGNVSEMTSYITGREPARIGKLKPTDALIWRGGNFEEDKESLKTTYRWTIPAVDGRSSSVGFRCVISEDDWKAEKK